VAEFNRNKQSSKPGIRSKSDTMLENSIIKHSLEINGLIERQLTIKEIKPIIFLTKKTIAQTF
jgi:hypothetical protein